MLNMQSSSLVNRQCLGYSCTIKRCPNASNEESSGTGAYGWVGDKTGELSYKYLKLQDKIVTTKEMDEFRKKFADEKAKSNADYQKNLDRHIQE